MNEMTFSANFKAYLQSRDPDLKVVESENGDLLFEKLTYTHHYRSITHVSVAADHSSTTLRIYVLDFFSKDQKDSGSSYRFTNDLNFDYRFGSYYSRGQTLIAEQDLLLTDPYILPPVTKYLSLLQQNIFDITKKARTQDNS